MKVEAGKFVKVEYTGTFDNGEVFDSSEEHGSLLGFTVGSGDLIKGWNPNRSSDSRRICYPCYRESN